MAIIKLTHIKTTFTEKETFFGLSYDFDYHWDKKPKYHDTTGCKFWAESAEVEGELVNGAMFNGSFVRETPEEILRLIKEAENVSV